MVDVLAVAETWSFWDGGVPGSVPRDVQWPTQLRDSIALVVQGVRRCGKSTLLQQLVTHYRLNPRHCAFVNFEDPRLANALTYQTLDELVAQFRQRNRRVRRLYFFLDEIQWVDGWQRWLRSQLDRADGNTFVVTGSNGQLLSGELGSSLTGRHLAIELFPFDLFEARQYIQGLELEQYLDQGGFPEPLGISDGDSLRRQYFEDIVERDVRERLGARSSQPIRHVVQMVFESAGSELSLRRVAGAAGIAVDTASAYLEASESAHLLFACPYFAFSERKRASRNRKYYPVDNGLRRVVVTRTGSDRGKALECATFIGLRRRFRDVFYWRERGEVDFVVHDQNRILPVQVSWDGLTERHERALTEFYELFPQASEAVIVTEKTFEATFDPRSGRLQQPARSSSTAR